MVYITRCQMQENEILGLKLQFVHQLFIRDFILGFLWLLAGFYFVYVASPFGKVSPGNLMSVDR